jgi:hypothetical protein
VRRGSRVEREAIDGEARALPELGDLQLDRTGTGFPEPIAVSVALVGALGRPLAVSGAAQALDLGRHQPFGGEGQQLAHEVAIGPLLDQLEKGHSVGGHRRLRAGSRFATRSYTEDRR